MTVLRAAGKGAVVLALLIGAAFLISYCLDCRRATELHLIVGCTALLAGAVGAAIRLVRMTLLSRREGVASIPSESGEKIRANSWPRFARNAAFVCLVLLWGVMIVLPVAADIPRNFAYTVAGFFAVLVLFSKLITNFRARFDVAKGAGTPRWKLASALTGLCLVAITIAFSWKLVQETLLIAIVSATLAFISISAAFYVAVIEGSEGEH